MSRKDLPPIGVADLQEFGGLWQRGEREAAKRLARSLHDAYPDAFRDCEARTVDQNVHRLELAREDGDELEVLFIDVYLQAIDAEKDVSASFDGSLRTALNSILGDTKTTKTLCARIVTDAWCGHCDDSPSARDHLPGGSHAFVPAFRLCGAVQATEYAGECRGPGGDLQPHRFRAMDTRDVAAAKGQIASA